VWGGPPTAPSEPVSGKSNDQRSSLSNSMAAATSAPVFGNAGDDEEQGTSARTGSISRKFLLAALLPAIAVGLAALFFIGLRVTSGFDALIKKNAQDVLIAMVNNIDSADFLGSKDQIDAITRVSNIGFVQAVKDENNTFFSAKNVEQEKPLRDAVEKLGATQSTLSAAGESFTVVSADVYVGTSGSGAREIIFAGDNKVPPPTKLFSLKVGVLDKEARGFVSGQVVQFIILLVLALAGAAYIANLVARRVTEPVVALTKAANRISLGEFGESIRVESNDELGDLAEALERMRTSLETAMSRMRKRR
jgi:HAMP domain-containing protein